MSKVPADSFPVMEPEAAARAPEKVAVVPTSGPLSVVGPAVIVPAAKALVTVAVLLVTSFATVRLLPTVALLVTFRFSSVVLLAVSVVN